MPSADTQFTSSAANWIATANRWQVDIANKYPRSISKAYDVLKCNGSIPFGWYNSTHSIDPITKETIIFNSETPVEWMCRMGYDSPLAAIHITSVPVMRPNNKVTSVRLTYNWGESTTINIGPDSSYWTCGHTGEQPCIFYMTAPCEKPLDKLFSDSQGHPIAVVTGWETISPSVIHIRAEKE